MRKLEKMTQAMLHQGGKFYTGIIVMMLLFVLVGCDGYKKYDPKEIAAIRERCMDMSISIIGEEEYFSVYNKMNDSVNNWINNSLGNYSGWKSVINYKIDSVLCINPSGDKLITSVLKRSLYNDSTGDFIDHFLGVKIDGEWYFFRGAGMVLPREYYQEDVHKPLSFEMLKQIATSNIYRRYLEEESRGKWRIREKFFSDLTSVAWCVDCTTQEQWNEAYMRQVRENWQIHKPNWAD